MSREERFRAREAAICHHFLGIRLLDPVDEQEGIPMGKERLDVGHAGKGTTNRRELTMPGANTEYFIKQCLLIS
jgi:hypothetical protein